MDLTTWMEAQRVRLDHYMDGLFGDAWPGSFAEPCRYPLFGGGKRVRPLLTIASYGAFADGSDVVLPAAAAIELIHTYSLIHDDLPCMDDDDVRRGRPTVHRAFDEATAVLAGDALLTEAFRVALRTPASAEVQVKLARELSEAAGYRGMVGGQAADIGLGASITDVEVLTLLHQKKTGALIRCAVRMGGIVAGVSPSILDELTRYGEDVGLAFQLADDVLDADEAESSEGPPNFVRLLGIEQTQALARECADRALQIADVHQSGVLRDLAVFAVERRL